MTNPRLAGARRLLREHKLDALLIRQSEETPTFNVRYLTGFTGSAAVVIVGSEKGSSSRAIHATGDRSKNRAPTLRC